MNWKELVQEALREDCPQTDVTSELVVPSGVRCTAEIISRTEGVVCGVSAAIESFRNCLIESYCEDGDRVQEGTVVMRVTGDCRDLLRGERVALNFLGRLSGIATLTRKFVDLVSEYDVKILDTRKTTPLLRDAEKYAVRVGGGFNHRRDLSDGIMVKENHIGFAGGLQNVVDKLRESGKLETAIIEVRTLEEAIFVAERGGKEIMLDNFSVGEVRRSVERLKERDVTLEVSGGVTLENVLEYAATGVDRISVGSITHTAPSLDLSMLFVEPGG